MVDGPNMYEYGGDSPVSNTDPLGSLAISGNCHGKEGQISEEIEASCDKIDTTITDRKLAKCIKKRCKRPKVKCKDCCDPTECGHNNWWFGIIPSRKIVICANTVTKNFGTVAIHEWAHSCGWDEGEGKGVPGNDGRINCAD
jgi:hypothetical protein